MDDLHTIDDDHSSSLTLNSKVRSSLQTLSIWCRVGGICGFILTFAGFIFLYFAYVESVKYGSRLRDDEVFGLLVILLGTGLVFSIGLFSWNYGRKLKKAFNQNSQVQLESALANLKIMVGIVVSIAVIGTLIALFVMSVIIYVASRF